MGHAGNRLGPLGRQRDVGTDRVGFEVPGSVAVIPAGKLRIGLGGISRLFDLAALGDALLRDSRGRAVVGVEGHTTASHNTVGAVLRCRGAISGHRNIVGLNRARAVAVVAELRVVALEGAARDVDQLILAVRLVDRQAHEAVLVLVGLRGLVLISTAADVHRAASERVHAAAVLAVDDHVQGLVLSLGQVQGRAAADRHEADAVIDADLRVRRAACNLVHFGAVDSTVLNGDRSALDVERAAVAGGVRHSDGIAAKVDGDGLVHVHAGGQSRARIRRQILQQSHSIAVLCGVNSVLEGVVVGFADLRNRLGDRQGAGLSRDLIVFGHVNIRLLDDCGRGDRAVADNVLSRSLVVAVGDCFTGRERATGNSIAELGIHVAENLGGIRSRDGESSLVDREVLGNGVASPPDRHRGGGGVLARVGGIDNRLSALRVGDGAGVVREAVVMRPVAAGRDRGLGRAAVVGLVVSVQRQRCGAAARLGRGREHVPACAVVPADDEVELAVAVFLHDLVVSVVGREVRRGVIPGAGSECARRLHRHADARAVAQCAVDGDGLTGFQIDVIGRVATPDGIAGDLGRAGNVDCSTVVPDTAASVGRVVPGDLAAAHVEHGVRCDGDSAVLSRRAVVLDGAAAHVERGAVKQNAAAVVPLVVDLLTAVADDRRVPRESHRAASRIDTAAKVRFVGEYRAAVHGERGVI